MQPEAFTIAIPDHDLADLRERLARTRLPGDFGNDQGRYGVQQEWLADALAYWRDEYDWRTVEAEMNRLAHYRVTIDGVPVHFIHHRSRRKNAIPLILSHGWPWTFWDWRDVIEPLANPASASDPAFDVIVPSLPGFGFSTPLQTTGLDVAAIAALWHRLMTQVLGYPKFGAAGGDWGSLISAQLGHAYPQDVIGVGLTLPFVPGESLDAILARPFPPEEQWMAERMARTRPTIMSHIAVQMADPQTLAYALADSPAGLAAWLWERRRAWSDPRHDSAARDIHSLCTLASIYWLTNSIGSSFRIYAEHFSKPWDRLHEGGKVIEVPTAFAIAPKELAMAPRAVVAEFANLRRWTVLERGGHFVPAEAPEELVGEYRAFFASLG
jgi:pimeloyl-ACP methyl ester carboxylesterase